jgi:hypothetical protein
MPIYLSNCNPSSNPTCLICADWPLLILEWIQFHFTKFFSVGNIVDNPAPFDSTHIYMMQSASGIKPSSTRHPISFTQPFWLITMKTATKEKLSLIAVTLNIKKESNFHGCFYGCNGCQPARFGIVTVSGCRAVTEIYRADIALGSILGQLCVYVKIRFGMMGRSCTTCLATGSRSLLNHYARSVRTLFR